MHPLHDPIIPIQILGLMWGALCSLKLFFAMTAWRSDFPSKSAMLIALWCAVYAIRHSLVVIGHDWRNLTWLHWLQVLTMLGACYGMIQIMRWKYNLINERNNLELRITALEDRVQQIISDTGYLSKNDNGGKVDVTPRG